MHTPAPLVLLLVLMSPLAANAAEVYRCVDKGVVTYQDFPCRDGGSVVRLAPDPPPPPGTSSQENLEEMRKRVDTMARERRQREIAAQIDVQERIIAQLDRQEAAELDTLRKQRGFAANNFQADGWDRDRVDRAIVEEAAAVSAKYRDRSEPARRRLESLRNEQKTLTPARQ